MYREGDVAKQERLLQPSRGKANPADRSNNDNEPVVICR
jgi:hypothetical protein